MMRERGRILIVTLSTCLTLLLLIGALLGQEKRSQEPYQPLAVLSEVLSRIQTDYVEDPSFSKVTEGALHGLLESLDPYSSYLSPAEYKEYQKGSRGNASIGAVVFKRGGLAGIVATLPGGPAQKAGLSAGDIIESIDGISTQDLSYAGVASRLEGPAGSTVRITVVRERAQDPQPFELKREVGRPLEIEARIVEPGIGYLKLVALPKGEAQKIAEKIKNLRRLGAKKLILDFRDNAMGDLPEGVATANLFLRRGLIGYVEGQQYPRQSFTAEESKFVSEEPLEILVNESTGGAAEIAAAAILENHRGDVVGARTFGMGSIQKTIPLDDGSALILSVAKYYSPVGKQIQESGVTPTVVVLQDRDVASLQGEEEGGEEAPVPTEPQEDLPLKRAIELLKEQEATPQAA
ncbi:MAG: PDZ domain-containing protein [Acidobacteria bacterium]|nr:PDZ domain-containing protein [Acidobacteriota bacterium]